MLGSSGSGSARWLEEILDLGNSAAGRSIGGIIGDSPDELPERLGGLIDELLGESRYVDRSANVVEHDAQPCAGHARDGQQQDVAAPIPASGFCATPIQLQDVPDRFEAYGPCSFPCSRSYVLNCQHGAPRKVG